MFFLSCHMIYTLQTERSWIAIFLWFDRAVLFFAWLTFNTNSLAMCQRLNHNFSAFDFSFLFMATFKVLESLLSALNILFLPLITNFSPLPARVFPFANQRDIILHLDLWIQNYAKDLWRIFKRNQMIWLPLMVRVETSLWNLKAHNVLLACSKQKTEAT